MNVRAKAKGINGKRPCNECWTLITPEIIHQSGGRILCRECDRKRLRELYRAELKYCHGCGKRRWKDQFQSLEKGSRCLGCLGLKQEEAPRETKACKTCEQELPLSDFGSAGKGYLDSRCKPCKIKENKGRKRCSICRKTRQAKMFGYRKRNSTGLACIECVPLRTVVARDDVAYDYAFARDVLDLGHEAAVQWLTNGYRYSEAAYQEIDPNSYDHWEPDPLDDELMAA